MRFVHFVDAYRQDASVLSLDLRVDYLTRGNAWSILSRVHDYRMVLMTVNNPVFLAETAKVAPVSPCWPSLGGVRARSLAA